MLIANATGCSSIYGGNLPTTPWAVNADGRGPGLVNSLFEDNAEFGFGMRLAIDKQTEHARELLTELAGQVATTSSTRTPRPPTRPTRPGIAEQRSASPPSRQARRRTRPRPARSRSWPTTSSARASGSSAATAGPTTSATAASTTCWPPGATSTSSCSTPRCTPTPAARPPRPRRSAPSAKFAAGGKPTGKKDLGLMAMAYGNVYVAQIAWAPRTPDREGLPRGRVLPGPVADHRLQPLHRPRPSATSTRCAKWRTRGLPRS
jgi:pyruvate-ferredoxin/flavodoxin oxidoreductase